MIDSAKGCWMPEPGPMASAKGNKVKIAASVVIVIGRKRFLLASRKASCAGMRCAS